MVKSNESTLLLALLCSFLLNCNTKSTSHQIHPDFSDELESKALLRQDQEILASTYSVWSAMEGWVAENGDQNGLDLEINHLGPDSITAQVHDMAFTGSSDPRFMIGSYGGIWSWQNNPDRFDRLDHNLPALSHRKLAVDPFDPNHILIGTGDNNFGVQGIGMLRSTDGGSTFSIVAGTTPQTNPHFTSCYFLQFHPTVEDVIYIGVTDDALRTKGYVYRSDDGGNTFSLVYSSATDIVDEIAFLQGQAILLAEPNRGIVHSPDGQTGFTTSLSWPFAPRPNLNFLQGATVHASSSHPDTAYAVFADYTGIVEPGGYIYKTENGGTTWTSGDSVSIPGLWRGIFRQPYINLYVGVSPHNDDFVIVGGTVSFFSTDAGQTWTHTGNFGTSGHIEADVHDIHFDVSDPSLVYVGYDHGLRRYDFTDVLNGTTTTPTSNEISRLNGFDGALIYHGDFFPTGDQYVVGLQDWGRHVSRVDGEYNIRTGDGASQFIHPQNQMISYYREFSTVGVLKKVTNIHTATDMATSIEVTIHGEMDVDNNGVIDDPIFTQIRGRTLQLNPINGDQLFFYTHRNLWRSTNQGTNWTAIEAWNPSGHAFYDMVVSRSVSPTLYTAQFENGTFKIVRLLNAHNATSGSAFAYTNPYPALDNGLPNGTPTWMAINPNKTYIIYLTTSTNRLIRLTFDPNVEYSNLSGNLPPAAIRCVEADLDDPDNTLWLGTDFGLFVTPDLGDHWFSVPEIPPTRINQLKWRPEDQSLWVFTFGHGVWKVVKNRPVTTACIDPVQNRWIGPAIGDWHAADANWSNGHIPFLCEDVLIESGHAISVSAGQVANCNYLEVQEGAELHVDELAELNVCAQ